MAAPQLTVAPDPVDEAIVLVVRGETLVVEVGDPAWLIALHAREETHARELAERDLRGKRALIEKLKVDQAAAEERKRQARPDRALIETVFENWRRAANKPRCKLTPERFDMTAARVDEEYGLDIVTMAAVGVGLNPYVIDGEVRNDYKTAMKDGESVERYANRCPREHRETIRAQFVTQTAMAL